MYVNTLRKIVKLSIVFVPSVYYCFICNLSGGKPKVVEKIKIYRRLFKSSCVDNLSDSRYTFPKISDYVMG